MIQNLPEIQEMLSTNSQKPKTLCELPVLGIFEFLYKVMSDWMDIVNQRLLIEKVNKSNKSNSELNNLEMLKWTIQDLLLKYD